MRDKSIDAIAGLLILFMIYGHIMSWTGLTDTHSFVILDRVFCFFMPWFFYKAGMFFKQTNLQNIVKTGYRRLIIPYIVWGGVGIASYYLPSIILGQQSVGHVILLEMKTILWSGKIEGNSAIWFLLSLFFARIIKYFLSKLEKIHLVVIAMCILSAIVISIKQVFPTMCYPEYLYNTLLGVMFFSLGVYLNERQYQKRVYWVSILLYSILLIAYPSRVDFFHSRLIEGNVMLWILESLCGIVVINNISREYFTRFTTILQYIGINSMIYLVLHFVIANVVRLFVEPLGYSPQILALFYFLSILILTPMVAIVLKKDRCKRIIGL